MPYLEPELCDLLDLLGVWKEDVREQLSQIEIAITYDDWSSLEKPNYPSKGPLSLHARTQKIAWECTNYCSADPTSFQAAYDVILAAHQYRDVAKLPSLQEIHRTIDVAMYALNRMEAAILDKATDKPSTSKSQNVLAPNADGWKISAKHRVALLIGKDYDRKWTAKALAELADCHEGTVKRSPAWIAWRADKKRLPSGNITKDGNLDAWDQD